MTQDEAWLAKYNEVIAFMRANVRNPSRYDPVERGAYCNWIKHNKKLMNAGKMKESRIESFKGLLTIMNEIKHKNQYR